ncbi:MAG: exodeoxyribonuclease VII large subunit [Chitinophagaceae bacterium]|nr:exodeoxyribonuclease VII large subunit [Chitinophagaceae bacterium]
MPIITKLSAIVTEIDELIKGKFVGRTFWITAELSGVKKYPDKRWCFFDFVEKNENEEILIKGVSWARSYQNIELFESITGMEFKSGIEITCKVCVSFYKAKSYPQLEIIEIDFAHAIGQFELEKQKTLKRLIAKNKAIKYLSDGRYLTTNNFLKLPKVIQRIALITAPNSDGQRDFKKVIMSNKYDYAFVIQEYLTVVQGNNASQLIIEKLKLIQDENFDAIVIVRGGGSDTDFAAFNDYELAKFAATFPIPILTGIGHDRNTSIVDLMVRQLRTPTEVGTFIIERNMNFEYDLQQLKDRFFEALEDIIENRKEIIIHFKQRVKNLDPTTILKKGFAILKCNNKIVIDPKNIKVNTELQVIMKNEIINSTVNKKIKNEKKFDI